VDFEFAIRANFPIVVSDLMFLNAPATALGKPILNWRGLDGNFARKTSAEVFPAGLRDRVSIVVFAQGV
jgi:hypothetical protein